jgi:ATP-dependent DNA helicase PIF1
MSLLGGIQVVLVGDFFQLPPIEKTNFIEKQNTLIKETEARFAYQSTVWQKLSPLVCYINEQHRQNDDDFLSLLLAIRTGAFQETDQLKINARFIKKEKMPKNIPKLYSHNLDVDRVNDEMLSQIQEDDKIFEMDSSGSANLVTTLKKGCLSPETLSLKKGAVVMCTKNNQREHFVNGTLGTVLDFDSFTGHPIIKTKNGKHITISPMDWVIEENGKIKAQITQIPLRLAWAITVHKSQGMSMDCAIMDLSSVFEYGQGYVALSRVKRLDGLYLLGCNQKALEVHPEILKQDKSFKENSLQVEKFFQQLSKEEIKQMHKNFALASKGEWTD